MTTTGVRLARRRRGMCNGSVGARRGIELEGLDPENYRAIADIFGIAAPLVQEIEWMNEDAGHQDTPEKRWQRVREWAERNLKETIHGPAWA